MTVTSQKRKIKPIEVWKKFFGNSIDEIFIKRRIYEARIKTHDKIFIATNGGLKNVTEAVAWLAIYHLFEINLEQGNKFHSEETMVLRKSNDETFEFEDVSHPMVVLKSHRQKHSSDNESVHDDKEGEYITFPIKFGKMYHAFDSCRLSELRNS